MAFHLKVYFDVPVRADVFGVAAEHVVYNEIVVPGAVEMQNSQRIGTLNMARV